MSRVRQYYLRRLAIPDRGAEIPCRRADGGWAWRQADRAKTTFQTTNALVTTEGVNEILATTIQAAMAELVSLVSEHCGGDVSWSMLDRDHPWAVMGPGRAASQTRDERAGPNQP